MVGQGAALDACGRLRSGLIVPAILETTQVTKQYPQSEQQILSGVDLSIDPGETVAIMGPSGCGKSTLLNIVGLLDQATTGSVSLEGESCAGWSEEQRAATRCRKIGFVFQRHHLLPHLSVLENVLIPTVPARAGEGARERAQELLAQVRLDHRLAYRPAQLSGGECQRVAVVRALINQPALLLADEPTGSLDHDSSAAIGDLLVSLNREMGLTLVVVTHAADLAERMGRVLTLRDGTLHA